MARIRLGFRSIRTKVYIIDNFDFIKDNVDKFSFPYEGLDIWHNKESDTKTLQVEKRVVYFHFMFIPVFPVEKVWTLRKEDGKLYSLAGSKYKIENLIKKTYYPWYSFLLPLIIVAVFGTYTLNIYAQRHIRKYQYGNKLKANKEKLISQLDSMSPPYYLVIQKPRYGAKSFKRVDSIKGNIFFTSFLPTKLDTFKSYTEDYFYHKALKKYKLENSTITKDSLISLIPNNPEDNSYLNKHPKFQKIISIKSMEIPQLEISFNVGGFRITNSGKPVTLLDFEDLSPKKNHWTIESHAYIDTDKKLQANFDPKSSNQQIEQQSYLILTFTDDENIYDYEIKGTYYRSGGSIGFINKSVKQLNNN